APGDWPNLQRNHHNPESPQERTWMTKQQVIGCSSRNYRETETIQRLSRWTSSQSECRITQVEYWLHVRALGGPTGPEGFPSGKNHHGGSRSVCRQPKLP